MFEFYCIGRCRKGFNLLITLFLEFLLIFYMSLYERLVILASKNLIIVEEFPLLLVKGCH